MFDMQKDLDERDFNPADQLLKMMDSISWAWQVIRQTAAELRVNDLCRIVSRNLNYQAESVGGGKTGFRCIGNSGRNGAMPYSAAILKSLSGNRSFRMR